MAMQIVRRGLVRWIAVGLAGAVLTTAVVVGRLRLAGHAGHRQPDVPAPPRPRPSPPTWRPRGATSRPTSSSAPRTWWRSPGSRTATEALGFGHYRNPVSGGGDSGVPADILAHVDRSALAPGGFTLRTLGLTAGLTPADWTTVVGGGPHGEHGVGFLLLQPADWRAVGARRPHPERRRTGSVQAVTTRSWPWPVTSSAPRRRHRGPSPPSRGRCRASAAACLQFVDVLTRIVANDRAQPWRILGDMLGVMPLPGTDRGLAFLAACRARWATWAAAWCCGDRARFAQQDIPPDYLGLITKWAGNLRDRLEPSSPAC